MKNLPLHGGDLVAASERYSIAVTDWIDLSTGLNPRAYPVGELSQDVFSSLPYLQDAFFESVQQYYQYAPVLAVGGTQQAIQALPDCLLDLPLLVPEIGYREYADCWMKADRRLQFYPSLCFDQAKQSIEQSLARNDNQHLLIINPNNPTGICFSAQQIVEWSSQLSAGAYVIVDEAFMDVDPDKSLLQLELPDNVIVFRSFGKFFGLAGVRLGFVFATQSLLDCLNERCGLWNVNGPAQAIAIQAFADEGWQQSTRRWLPEMLAATQSIFSPLIVKLDLSVASAVLFFTLRLDAVVAEKMYQFFAERGVLLRLHIVDDEQSLLRVGLLDPEDTAAVARVNHVVAEFCQQLDRC